MSGRLSRLARPARRLLDAFIDAVEPVVAALSPGARWVAVETSDETLSFHRTTRGGTLLVGTVAPGEVLPEPLRRAFGVKGGVEAELRLPADRLVAAQLKVPLEAAGFASEIVASRLDRLTPWRPEKLLYGFAVARTPGPDAQVTVDVVATSREIVAAGMSRLATFGLLPSRVGSAAQPVEEPLRIDLLRGENDTAGKARRRRIGTATLFVLALSVAGFLASTVALSLSAGEVADADAALSATRRKIASGANGGGEREREAALLAAKTPARATFVLIDRLATILPDTTYLDELDILPQSLRLAGTSAEASALVGILEAEPTLSEARFAAPVTRQEDGRDRFDISVVRDTGEGAPAP
jgi:general secretion pathway protein L